jgi:hypothetical protein
MLNLTDNDKGNLWDEHSMVPGFHEMPHRNVLPMCGYVPSWNCVIMGADRPTDLQHCLVI